jgi:hypothetical protein
MGLDDLAELPDSEASERAPQNHCTIAFVTQLLEEFVYNPGMTFAEWARAVDTPTSSVHGFIRGFICARCRSRPSWIARYSNGFDR